MNIFASVEDKVFLNDSLSSIVPLIAWPKDHDGVSESGKAKTENAAQRVGGHLR